MLLKTGDQLRAARALAGLTQSELAKRCGMHINSISAMEKRGPKSLTSGGAPAATGGPLGLY
jgi:transcriptional regulator with XRE-family HTH domain